MKYVRFSCLLLLSLYWLPLRLVAQLPTITLDSSYALAEKNFPLTRQYALNDEKRRLSLENIHKGWLPQFNVQAQATWQSEVTSIPVNLPNIHIPAPDKDQYKFYLEGNQVIYDGGQINAQKKLKATELDMEEQQNNVTLYQLRDKVNQVYFGILLLDRQQENITTIRSDLEATLHRIKSAIKNGVMLRSNEDNLQAELLRLEQRRAELQGTREGLLAMLAWLTGADIDSSTQLVRPADITFARSVNRPELLLFEAGKGLLDRQEEMLQVRNRPRVGAFLQAGYGKPALNMLSDQFDSYFLGGLRFQMPLTGWYNNRNDRQLISLNKQAIELQKEQFLYNLQLQQKQQFAENAKLRAMIDLDDQIIATREKSLRAAQSQLDHGVITISEFITQSNKIEDARNNKALHEMQLLMNYYNQKYLTGN